MRYVRWLVAVLLALWGLTLLGSAFYAPVQLVFAGLSFAAAWFVVFWSDESKLALLWIATIYVAGMGIGLVVLSFTELIALPFAVLTLAIAGVLLWVTRRRSARSPSP